MRKEAVRFLHIPKTAGSTFTDILKRQFINRKYFEFTGNLDKDINNFNKLSPAQKADIALFIGHAPLTTKIPEADNALLFTFLREPVSRVKSFCQHVAEGKSPYLLELFPPQKFDLDYFLASGNTELANLQTKMLAGQYANDVCQDLNSLSKRELMNLALKNLFEKIDAYGITEFFDESIIWFAHKYNWRIPFYFRRNTRSPRKKIIFDKRHIKKIIELNQIDIEVYKIARSEFVNKINSNQFPRKYLSFFKCTNPIVGHILRNIHIAIKITKKLLG